MELEMTAPMVAKQTMTRLLKKKRPKGAEGNFGLFSYLESSAKIWYDIERLEQFAGFSVYTNNEAARQIGSYI